MARGTVITDTANSGTSQGGEEERPENDSDSDSGVGGRGKREREEDSEYGAAPIPYKVGQHIDVLDSVDRWAEAKVRAIYV